MQISFSKSTGLQLSKTVPGMSLRPLVVILCKFEVWSKRPKKGVGGAKKKSSQFSILDKSADSADFHDP